MNERDSRYELLRIVCMIFIIGFHMGVQTSVNSLSIEDGAIEYLVIIFLSSGGRFVCNTFVIIGAWFLTDSIFKAQRVLDLWIEILTYSVTITGICLLIIPEYVNRTLLIQACLPILGRPVWFGAEYICLLLLTPWLNQLLEDIVIRQTRKIVFLLTILIIGCATFLPVEHTTPAFSELGWFCYLYLLTGLYKRKQIFVPQFIEQYSYICFILVYGILCSLKILGEFWNTNILVYLYGYYRAHYEALPGFLCSFFLFFSFKKFNIRRNKVINRIAQSTFAIYIIHQTPAFYNFMWNGLFHVDNAVSRGTIIPYAIGCILCIILSGVLIDSIRMRIFSDMIKKSRLYLKMLHVINDLYKTD